MHQKLIVPDPFITQLEKHLSVKLHEPAPKSLSEYAKVIGRVSEGLKMKKRREEFLQNSYLENKNYRQAYLLYYTTCNLLKIYYPLAELEPSGFFGKHPTLRILDLGSGTGAMILGFSFWMKEFSTTHKIHFTACDQSAEAFRELATFYGEFNFDHAFEIRQTDLEKSLPFPEKFNGIIGGNFLNELSEAARRNIFNILNENLSDDGFVIFIEPERAK